ncbi:Thiamine-phosphate pyrophosphorylase [Wickerhamomyces ciferrii]|uniref:Thiamine-phosphate pyrophosphorylase n=1 Tax=Wickerhamomyces ciferrii (strain ATCC 14091 / BCRC 22168 / CBS 111 / JCM 3599 / NBRC 0793 / NRRL Y-1031 F-60-10) TaxID=1206466 RepID=K0KUQ4_WICCF|nr:Thiamine-phosphate pyrophosphorylase [Wickerhamomyces ciferrii]CCH45667.1 Thiamine-phosphate pyrophosphorylase [Wickerhamomyces ciferrii]
MTQNVDYSLYLVTNAEMVPEGYDFLGQVQAAIDNGVTIVQLREKEIDTREFIKRAQAVHELTRKAGIPLIINDRVDIALAINCEGVHVGQDDMPAKLVRKLLGPDKIIGVSVGFAFEAREVIEEGVVDYIGVGPMFETNTKKNMKKLPFGPLGVRGVLKVLRDEGGDHVRTVGIGGINDTNVQRVLYTSAIPGRSLDGVAVVSNIMANKDAAGATKKLSELIHSSTRDLYITNNQYPIDYIKPSTQIIQNVIDIKPMIHHITNNVVKTFSANVALAIGASPVMSEEVEDFEDFSKFPNAALLLNIGTPRESEIDTYLKAVSSYNKNGNPVIFDPVGAGASKFRKDLVKRILNLGYLTVIKGNEGEIFTTAGIDKLMKGVDNVGKEKQDVVIEAAKKLAISTRSIVVVTGEKDIIVDGWLSGEYKIPSDVKQRVVTIKGGHKLMGGITGSGCSLGSAISAYITANRNDPFLAVVTAVALFNQAGGIAGKKVENEGTGSFISEFLNQLNKVTIENKPENWNVVISSV